MKEHNHNTIETMLRAYGKKQIPSRSSFEQTLNRIQNIKKSPVRSPFMSFIGYAIPAVLVLVLVLGATHKKKDVAVIIEAGRPETIEPITQDEFENEMALNEQDSELEASLAQTLVDDEQTML